MYSVYPEQHLGNAASFHPRAEALGRRGKGNSEGSFWQPHRGTPSCLVGKRRREVEKRRAWVAGAGLGRKGKRQSSLSCAMWRLQTPSWAGVNRNKTGDLHPRLELGRAHEGQHLHEETPCTPTPRRGLGTSLASTSWVAFQWIRVKESVLVCYTCRSDESQTGRLKQQTSFVFWRLEVLDQGVGRVGLIPPEGCQSVYCLSPGSLWLASHLWHSLACRSLLHVVFSLCVYVCVSSFLFENGSHVGFANSSGVTSS